MRKFSFRTLRNNYGGQIERVLGLDEQQLERDYEDYTVKQPMASERDFMWSLFNRMILASGTDYFTQSNIYHAMAVFVSEYEGKKGNQYKKLSLKAEISQAKRLQLELEGVVLELEIVADPDCSHSMKYDGVRFPIDDNLTDLPLANEDCEREFCRCTTGAVPKRDENGSLVWKS